MTHLRRPWDHLDFGSFETNLTSSETIITSTMGSKIDTILLILVNHEQNLARTD